MSEASDQVVRLYRDHAADWIQDRGDGLFAGSGGPDEAIWLERFTRGWPPGAKVLDVGCGSGHPLGAALLARGFKVTGLDASPDLIAHARRTLPQGDWRIGDMRNAFSESLPESLSEDLSDSLPKGPFDGVLAWHSLFHLTPQAQTDLLPHLAARVAQGGRLMFTAGPDHGEVVGRWRGEDLYHASLAPDVYRNLLTTSGLTPDETVEPGADYRVYLAHRA